PHDSLASPANREHWNLIEEVRRRLLSLHLPVLSQTRGWPHGLAFDLIEDHPAGDAAERVLTQHADGVITINVAEADDVIAPCPAGRFVRG
ncbi:MAG: putative zinc-binding metallopeptidase, partial [Gammaproteobacteria bacterium]|nr:putative zinc-binding metallopeptidase [Gammaproteobacteria bacterium]